MPSSVLHGQLHAYGSCVPFRHTRTHGVNNPVFKKMWLSVWWVASEGGSLSGVGYGGKVAGAFLSSCRKEMRSKVWKIQ